MVQQPWEIVLPSRYYQRRTVPRSFRRTIAVFFVFARVLKSALRLAARFVSRLVVPFPHAIPARGVYAIFQSYRDPPSSCFNILFGNEKNKKKPPTISMRNGSRRLLAYSNADRYTCSKKKIRFSPRTEQTTDRRSQRYIDHFTKFTHWFPLRTAV